MGWALVLVVGIVLGALWFARRRAPQKTAWRRLVKLAGADEEAARRLVDFERRKDPSLDEAGAIRRALKRLERDRR